MNNSWTKKYAPRKLEEITGQQKVVQQVKQFVLNFPKVRRNALLLYGPTGAGKTCIAKAFADELNYELVELNASDFRDKESVRNILGNASRQCSLFGSKKIILVDEIDGVSGQQDRGGVGEVAEIVQTSCFPIIITANDAYSDKLKSLRKYCELVEVAGITMPAIISRLKEICVKEKIIYEEYALVKLAESAQGDLRAAINDLQMLTENRKLLTAVDVLLWGREREASLFEVLKLIFKGLDARKALQVSEDLDLELEELLLWLDQSIPAEYSGVRELAEAYNRLSDTDVFLSRIRRRQHWRFLLYARLLSVVGVQQAKEKASQRFVPHQRPELLLKLFIRAGKQRKMRGLAEQIGRELHLSSREIQQVFLPYLEFMEEHNAEYAEKIKEKLGIEI
jgi:replication factor C large subunit